MKFSLIVLTLVVVTIPQSADAAPVLFQNIPFVGEGELTTEDYVSALYQLSIALASILVVLRLIWAGAQYMLSEVVTSKETAKKEIKASLLGLLIILAAVTLLNTINPNLTQLDFLGNAPTVTPQTSGGNDGASDVTVGGSNSAVDFKPGQSVDSSVVEDGDAYRAHLRSCTENGGQFNYSFWSGWVCE